MHISSGNNILSTICVLMFIGFMVAALVFAIIYSRKKNKEDMALASQLGFTPLGKPDEELLNRLKVLYQPSRLNRVSNLAQKVEGTERIILFNATTSSPNMGHRSGSSANSESRNVAIISPYLKLPPFMLIRRMPALGPLGNVLNDFITTAASWGGFEEWNEVPPDFSLNYMLYTKGDAQVKEVFNGQVLSQIAQIQNVVARGAGDILVFNTYDGRRGVKLGASELAGHVQQARQLSLWLSSR